jgi:hypothetical protein
MSKRFVHAVEFPIDPGAFPDLCASRFSCKMTVRMSSNTLLDRMVESQLQQFVATRLFPRKSTNFLSICDL